MKEKQFIKYLESKGLAETTQKHYIHNTKLFLNWLGKEAIQITKDDVLNYLEYLKNQKNNVNQTRALILIAIRYYFTFLLENDFVTTNPTSFIKIRGTKIKRLHHIYTNEDLNELYDNFYNIYIRNFESSKYFSKSMEEYIKLNREKNYIVLGIFIYQGIQTKELKNIKISDINLQKATIKIQSGKTSEERNLPLKAVQIGNLINYIQNIRPQLITKHLTIDDGRMFFNFQYGKVAESPISNDLIHHLTQQVRKIDLNFRNFRQLRASVITNWLKTEGLRKTQYLAGHRSIQATERYLPNNLDSLIEDITKHHPF